MSKRSLTAALLILVAACSRPASKVEPDTEADKQAIASALKEATAAHHAGDAERWAAVFADDAIAMPPNQPAISGKAALQQWAGERFSKFKSTAEIKPVEIEVAGDWAFVRTAVSGAFTPKDGSAAMELDLKEIAIYRRQPDGAWKVARLITNSNRPPAATQKAPERRER